MKYLFLDDERNPKDVKWLLIGNVGSWGADWHVVRSYNQAVTWVLENGFPDVISFDHDLGYEEYDTTESGLVVVTKATEEKSGYDFAKWLIDHDIENNSMPRGFTFTVHSLNPIGSMNISSIMNAWIKSK